MSLVVYAARHARSLPAVLAAVGATVCQAGAQAAAPTSARACVVANVHDGDTLRCRSGERVRLLLIDAPELAQGPHGVTARRALATLAPPGSTVLLEQDVEARDRYGRTLAYVWTPDRRTLVNEAMAAQGMALPVVYPPNVRRVETIRRAVAEARAARRGLRATEAFACPPREHRRGRC